SPVEALNRTDWDNTSPSNELSYLRFANDAPIPRFYTVNRSEVMGVQDFDTSKNHKWLEDDDPISSVVVELWYNTSTNYSGTSGLVWSIQGISNTTLFAVENTNETNTYNVTDLYPLGVDTVDKIKTLNLSFENNDALNNSKVMFDKLTLNVSRGQPSRYDRYDLVVYNGTLVPPEGSDVTNFSAQDGIVYMDSNHNGSYTFGEPIIKLSHAFGYLNENDTVLQSPNSGGWTAHFASFPVNDDMTPKTQEQPSVGADEWGNVYVVWKDYRTSLPTIHFSGTVEDFWPPDIESVDGTTTSITITFSEPVNASSFNSSFALDPDIGGAWSWDTCGYIASFTPSSGLLPKGRYDITITTGLEDISGNHMTNDFHTSFTLLSLPVVMHSAVKTAEIKTPIPVVARVLSAPGIQNVTVFYKKSWEKNYTLGYMSLLI
ncbi:MAG: Ig-like domain-containing protein, partial [Thermoplasmata archaeon]|nr:Ig-like domain-containing protein [Thermoplasmata archaeon]